MAKVKAGAATVAPIKPDITSSNTRSQEGQIATASDPINTKRRQPDSSSSHSPSKRIKQAVVPLSLPRNCAKDTAEQVTSALEDLNQTQIPDNGDSGGEHAKSLGTTEAKHRGSVSPQEATETLQARLKTPFRYNPSPLEKESSQISRTGSSLSRDISDSRNTQLPNFQQSGVFETTLAASHSETSMLHEHHSKLNSFRSSPQGQEKRVLAISQSQTHRMIPGLLLERQIYPVLDTIARQILCTCADMPLEEPNPRSNDHSPSHEALRPLQSLFKHAISFLDHSGSFIDGRDAVKDDEFDEHFIWQVNIAAALSLIFAPSLEYNDLDALHTKYIEFFCGGEINLQQWQIALLIEVKRRLWIAGVGEDIFSETDGLNRIFEVKGRDRISEQIKLECSKIRTGLQTETIDPPLDILGLRQPYREGLILLAREILTSAPDPKGRLSSRAYNDREKMDQGIESTCWGSNVSSKRRSSGELDLSDSKLTQKVDEKDRNGHVEDPNVRSVSTLVSGADGQMHVSNPARSDSPRERSTLDAPSPLGYDQLGFDAPSSTQEQYEKAKLAASAKAAAKNKGIPLQPSQRRPWSPEEENALMTGLDRVQGPHWSQILAMYGPGGSISEILKDRNQVQLKDKARNLKLFFLKSGHEVPNYLKNVTGELKTRAPAQAARSDAKEMFALSGSENHSSSDTFDLATARQDEFRQNGSFNSHSTAVLSPTRGVVAAHHDKQDDQRQQRKEDEEDLSNAIQLALRAIQERNGVQMQDEDHNEVE